MSFYRFARGLASGVLRLMFRIRIEGLENLPKDQTFVVCANHKSNLDPPFLGLSLPITLRYMAKEELFRNKLFGSLLRAVGAFPIRRGKSDVGALRAAVKMLENGECVAIFPEGARGKHKDHLRKGKQGAALIAVKAGVNILPVGIEGEYKLFSKMTLRVGKLISLEEYAGQKVDSEVLQQITDGALMPAIAELAGVKTYEDRDC